MQFTDEVKIKGVISNASTDRAVHCVINEKGYWIPKSQISDNSEVWECGHEGILILSPWWAEKEGLI